MKVFCAVLVLLAVSQTAHLKNVEINVRTPFYQRQRTGIDSLIVNGRPADIADFPHHLGLLDLQRGGYICGAVNIAPLWALSAAHCLARATPPEFINLWGGSTSRLTGGIVFMVAQYINHPQYVPSTLNNDVSVIRVDVRFASNHQDRFHKIYSFSAIDTSHWP